MENIDVTAKAFQAMVKRPPIGSLRQKTAAYESRFEQWAQERQSFIQEHGPEAWDAKVDREIAVMYPEST